MLQFLLVVINFLQLLVNLHREYQIVKREMRMRIRREVHEQRRHREQFRDELNEN